MSGVVVQLHEARADADIRAAVAARDASIVAEVERRFAETLADMAELAGVSVAYVEALLRRDWKLPLPESEGGGRGRLGFNLRNQKGSRHDNPL